MLLLPLGCLCSVEARGAMQLHDGPFRNCLSHRPPAAARSAVEIVYALLIPLQHGRCLSACCDEPVSQLQWGRKQLAEPPAADGLLTIDQRPRELCGGSNRRQPSCVMMQPLGQHPHGDDIASTWISAEERQVARHGRKPDQRSRSAASPAVSSAAIRPTAMRCAPVSPSCRHSMIAVAAASHTCITCLRAWATAGAPTSGAETAVERHNASRSECCAPSRSRPAALRTSVVSRLSAVAMDQPILAARS